jgi:undecaprenyl-diphosphatase
VTGVEAVVLGLVQGLGEFLPISSSGHLIAVPWILGWKEHGLAFDVALHLGTLVAVVAAFWRDWARLLGAGLSAVRTRKPCGDPHARLLWLLAAASVPGAVAGLVLEKAAETTFRSPVLVACTLAALGVLLLLADRHAAKGEGRADTVSVRDALLIGCAQALAIVPGVSRSGATITMALFLGMRREEAARFSFLLAMPITVGAALHAVPKLLRTTTDFSPLILGLVAAALSGFVAIRLLLSLVRTRTYLPFVVYRLALAVLILVLALVRGSAPSPAAAAPGGRSPGHVRAAAWRAEPAPVLVPYGRVG